MSLSLGFSDDLLMFRLKLGVYKKKNPPPFAEPWIDLVSIVLSELSQTEKDKYMISLIHKI